jgi:hypothetical protein
MNKRTIVIAALLGAAILSFAGCENMAHDLHKKGGGAAKTGPVGPGTQIPGGDAISLSSTPFTPVKYNYTVQDAGSITVTVTNTGTEATGPLIIDLEGDDCLLFACPASLGSIEPGGKDEFNITPVTGLDPEDYVARVRVSGTGGISGSLAEIFTVGFNGVIYLAHPAKSVLDGNPFPPAGNVYTIPYNTAVQVMEHTISDRIEVEGDASDHQTYIELVDASITRIGAGPALLLQAGAKVRLNLSGISGNELKTARNDSAGLQASAGTFLMITGGGRLEAAGKGASPGNGAGIGGGNNDAGGNITITNGTVTASGGFYGAGIGGGNGGDGGDITISGGTVTASGYTGAGIGGGNGGAGGEISISGGTVTASGGNNGAGIGGGRLGAGGEITISGGTVTAMGGTESAGIGGGGAGGEISISGGTVTARGGSGAGIGGIYKQPGGSIVISTDTGAVSVYAYSASGQGIGQGESGPATGSFSTRGTPVIFASSINNAGTPVNDPPNGIAGSGGVTVSMNTDSISVAGLTFDNVVTDVTVTLGSAFTVPSGATLTIPGGPPPPPLPSVPIFKVELYTHNLINNGTVVNNGRVTTGGGTVSGSGTWTGQRP